MGSRNNCRYALLWPKKAETVSGFTGKVTLMLRTLGNQRTTSMHPNSSHNIRATKIAAKGIMFPESQLTISNQESQPSVPDSPQSVVTNPNIAVALARVETQYLLPTAITKLAQVAQDRETQSQAQREAEECHLLSLGTQAPNDQTRHIPNPRKNIPRRDTPRP
jgi:hypothetical protein